MKIHLTSAYQEHKMLDAMLERATLDSIGVHQVCDNPEEADAILFVEDGQFDDYLYKGLRESSLVRRFPRKVFMYNEVDKPWCVLPGLYCNMPQRFFQENRQIAFPLFVTPNQYVKDIYKPGDTAERPCLFSFVGAASHRSRRAIFSLADKVNAVEDTSNFSVWDSSDTTRAFEGSKFAEGMAQSKFILCPRGIGTSSFRLFEAMEAGRAPVIMSNQWVETTQVDWDFAVRIPEHDIASLPEYLASIADEAQERGEAARRAWEAAYAPDKIFNCASDSVGELLNLREVAQSRYYLAGVRRTIIGKQVAGLAMMRKLRHRIASLGIPLEN